MYSRPTAPKSIGGVLDDTFKLFGVAWLPCWPLSLGSALIFAIPNLYLFFRGSLNVRGMIASQPPMYWALYLVVFVLYIALHLAILARINGIAANEPVDYSSALNTGMRLMPRSLLASIIVALPLVLVGIVAGIVMAAMGGGRLRAGNAFIEQIAIFAFVFLVAAIPYLIWLFYRTLYNVVLVTTDVSAMDALSASKQLVKGNWWRTATIFTVVFLLLYLLVFGGQFVGGAVIGVITRDTSLVLLGAQLIGAAISVFSIPWMGSAFLCVYFDLKLRKEGGDLAERVDALAKA